VGPRRARIILLPWFVMMIVPLAANMPPTTVRRDFRPGPGPGRCAHLPHALLQAYMPYMPEMHVAESTPLSVERQLAAGRGVALHEARASPFLQKPRSSEPIDRQMREAS